MDGSFSMQGCRIALLAGGDSAEREISLASGRNVALALSEAGHEPVIIDPAEINLLRVDWASFEVCFLGLHGGAGEDGRVQAALESLGVAYTGSGPAASRLAMSKSAAKQRFLQRGVPTLPYAVHPTSELSKLDLRQDFPRRLTHLGFPLVVKPECQGSSIGVDIANSPAELSRCVRHAAQFAEDVLFEPLIAGREFTIALLGRDPLPMIEIIAPQTIFTYGAKYASTATQYRFDCGLSPQIEATLYRVAVDSAEALRAKGLVRVDLMLDDQQRPWVLELNTIPGMSARSLAPRAAAAAGIDLPALVDWMVRDALSRADSLKTLRRLAITEVTQ